jgi:peptidoglycan hydrolase CwlO-like protein
MSHHRRILIVAIAVIVGLVALAGGMVAARPAAADELSATQEKLALTRERIDAARAEAKTLDGQIETLDARLTSIDDKIAALGSKIAVLQEKLSITEEKLAVVREQLRLKKLELAEAERELELQESAFEQRVVLSYKTREIDYLDIVLESSSFDDLVTRLHFVRTLVGSDNDLVGELEATRARVELEKSEIADKEQEVSDLAHELQQQNDQLLALQAVQQEQRDEAQAARADKRGALAAVESDLEELESQEKDLLAQSQALAGVISGGSSSGGGTGQLIWPCSGTVVSDFGWRIHPILGILRDADQGHRRRQGDHGGLVRGLRQLHDHRPRRRALDAVCAPELDAGRDRAARLPGPGDRVRRVDGALHRAASSLRDAGQWGAGRPDEISSLRSPPPR